MFTFKNLNLFSTALDIKNFCNEANKIAELHNLNTYSITIEVSKRCKTVAGNIHISMPKGVNVKINVSYDYYKKFGFDRTIGTLRHELAHLIAFNITGKLDHSYTFKRVCTEIGGTMNPDMAGYSFSASACDQYIKKINNWKYSCPNCSNTIERTRKLTEATKRKVCGICRTKVALWKEEAI